jgi:hypothetical protein
MSPLGVNDGKGRVPQGDKNPFANSVTLFLTNRPVGISSYVEMIADEQGRSDREVTDDCGCRRHDGRRDHGTSHCRRAVVTTGPPEK